MHFVPKKAGGTRPTTLRDARNLDLVPSVTEILKIADKPALTRWKVEQAVLAALTLPRIEGETVDEFMRRAKADSEKETLDAIEQGQDMHAAVEAFFKGEPVDPKHEKTVSAVVSLLRKLTDIQGLDHWVSEKTFATKHHNITLGAKRNYGGMIDLHSREANMVIDFKSKDFTDDEKRLHWDEQNMQLAAYAEGIGMQFPRRVSIFLSRKVPGLVRYHEWDQKDDTALMKFLCLLDYWHLDRKLYA